MKLLFTFLCLLSYTKCELVIQESGIRDVADNDIALIFYITLQNACEIDFDFSVRMIECCLEIKPLSKKDCKSMQLLGGNMGIIKSREIKNGTLIYPNLHLYNRKGICNIEITYSDHQGTNEIYHRICFETGTKKSKHACKTDDLNEIEDCAPFDCTEKYSGWKNFFNHARFICEDVPICLSKQYECAPDIAYSIITNKCTDLDDRISRCDLEKIENCDVELGYNYRIIRNFVCHNGAINSDLECDCRDNWVTTPHNDDYEPRLRFYHMCNIEFGAWNNVHNNKLRMTALIMAIFALTLVSKILIILCLLNWCYKYMKRPLICEKTSECEKKQCYVTRQDKLYYRCDSEFYIPDDDVDDDDDEEYHKNILCESLRIHCIPDFTEMSNISGLYSDSKIYDLTDISKEFQQSVGSKLPTRTTLSTIRPNKISHQKSILKANDIVFSNSMDDDSGTDFDGEEEELKEQRQMLDDESIGTEIEEDSEEKNDTLTDEEDEITETEDEKEGESDKTTTTCTGSSSATDSSHLKQGCHCNSPTMNNST